MTKEEVEEWAHRMGVYDRNILSMLDPDEWHGYEIYMMIHTDRELCISGHVIMVKGDEIRLASDEELIAMMKDDMFGDCGVDDPWGINIDVEGLESKIEPGARVSDTAGSDISVSRRPKKSRISLATAKQIMNSIPVDTLLNFPHPGEKLEISYSWEDENYYVFDILAIPEFMEFKNMTDVRKEKYCVIPWRVDKRTGWAEEWVE